MQVSHHFAAVALISLKRSLVGTSRVIHDLDGVLAPVFGKYRGGAAAAAVVVVRELGQRGEVLCFRVDRCIRTLRSSRISGCLALLSPNEWCLRPASLPLVGWVVIICSAAGARLSTRLCQGIHCSATTSSSALKNLMRALVVCTKISLEAEELRRSLLDGCKKVVGAWFLWNAPRSP